MHCGTLLAVLLGEVVTFGTAVAQQADGPCRCEPLHPGVVARLAESGVGLDGHALRLVDGDSPGRSLGSGGDQHQPFDPFRFRDGPFHGLKPSYRTAHQRSDAADAECIGQQTVRPHDVADRKGREILVPGFSRGGIYVQRPCRAVMRSDDVGADDVVARRVEEPPRFDRMGPPVRHVRIGRQRVANPRHVVFRGVQLAVGVVGDAQFRQRMSRFEFERPGGYVNLWFHYSVFSASFRSSLISSTCSIPSESRNRLG